MKLRTLIERVSRNRVLRRRLPKRYGARPIYVSPDAALRWLKRGDAPFDPDLLDAVDHCVAPGTVVWDIGANVGAFALPAAHRSGAKVVAVEADPFLVSLLQRSAAANDDLDMDVLAVAIGDHDGAARFRIAGRGRASNGLASGPVSTQHGESRTVMTVPLLSLDTMLADFPAPGLLKIDVEGGEAMALAGARRMLAEIRPTVFIEVTQYTADEVLKAFADARYDVFDIDESIAARVPAHGLSTNILAVPRAS